MRKEEKQKRSVRLRTKICFVIFFQIVTGLCLFLYHFAPLMALSMYYEVIDEYITRDQKPAVFNDITSCIFALIMIILAIFLLVGVITKKSDWVWAWLLANGSIGLLYTALLLYNLGRLKFWNVLENSAVMVITGYFISQVEPYYEYIPFQ